MNKESVLADLKVLLGIDDTSKDALLMIIINDCIDRVCGYCRVEEFPEGLVSLLPIMVHRAYAVGGYGRADPVGSVTMIKQGERTIQYEGLSGTSGDWLTNFTDRLEPFRKRRGRFPSECV